MRHLADVNVLLALVDPLHAAHPRVREWFDTLTPSDSLWICRSTQTSLLRLISTSSVMQGKALSLPQAWRHLDALVSSPGMGFAEEPPLLENRWRKLCKPFGACPKVVSDAYLAAFAIEQDWPLATLDGGFRNFDGLALVEELL